MATTVRGDAARRRARSGRARGAHRRDPPAARSRSPARSSTRPISWIFPAVARSRASTASGPRSSTPASSRTRSRSTSAASSRSSSSSTRSIARSPRCSSARPGPTKPEAIQLQSQVESWLQIRHGSATPKDPKEVEHPGLFLALTKFDMSLGALRSDNAKDRWDSRVQEACIDFWARGHGSWILNWGSKGRPVHERVLDPQPVRRSDAGAQARRRRLRDRSSRATSRRAPSRRSSRAPRRSGSPSRAPSRAASRRAACRCSRRISARR